MAFNQGYSITISNSVSEININIISIPQDRLENILTRHFDHIRRSKDYIGAIALTITLLIVLVTSEFKEKWLDSATWKALFLILFIISIGYSIYCVYNAIKHRDSVQNIIKDIKGIQPTE